MHPWARARAEGTRCPCPGVAFGLEQWPGSGCRTRRGAGNRAVSGGPARGEGAPAGVVSAYGRASASCTRSVPGCGLALSSPPSRERVGGRKLEGSPAVGSVGHLLLPPPPSSTLWAVCTAASLSATLRTHGHADRPCGEQAAAAGRPLHTRLHVRTRRVHVTLTHTDVIWGFPRTLSVQVNVQHVSFSEGFRKLEFLVDFSLSGKP